MTDDKFLQIAIDCAKEVYGVDPIMKSRRTMNLWARQAVYMELLKKGWSTTKTGLAFNRDHATVMHARDAFTDLIEYDKSYKEFHSVFTRLFELKTQPQDVIELIKERIHGIKSDLIMLGYDPDEFIKSA